MIYNHTFIAVSMEYCMLSISVMKQNSYCGRLIFDEEVVDVFLVVELVQVFDSADESVVEKYSSF